MGCDWDRTAPAVPLPVYRGKSTSFYRNKSWGWRGLDCDQKATRRSYFVATRPMRRGDLSREHDCEKVVKTGAVSHCTLVAARFLEVAEMGGHLPPADCRHATSWSACAHAQL